MTSILDLEQQDIELQLREIELKRRALAIKREKLEKEHPPSKGFRIPAHFFTEDDFEDNTRPSLNNLTLSRGQREKVHVAPEDVQLRLHYSRSAKETLMKIVNVTEDGCILIRRGEDSIISKKYNIRTLKWLKDNLSKWVIQQKTESHFWDKIARKYSHRFLEGDKISRTTIEKLCYLVDSGKMDKWFDEYDSLKNHGQSQLKI